MEQQKFEDDTGDLELTEDYIVIDDVATAGSNTYLDLSNLRKRKTKIISSAKETIENGKCPTLFHIIHKKRVQKLSSDSFNRKI